MFARKEEVRRFLFRYMSYVKSLDGHVLLLKREKRVAFQAHFRHRFPRCPNLTVQEFRSYLADFPRFREDLVTECEVHDSLKQVGFNKSPGLYGLPYEVYLRLLHIFVPILTDMFNH